MPSEGKLCSSSTPDHMGAAQNEKTQALAPGGSTQHSRSLCPNVTRRGTAIWGIKSKWIVVLLE